ncbi:tRNA (adenosine(37)-N6)-threonylcarbamoyltransferase complex ATPase subunit type 1 TsaE [Fontimonas sp. SYSU GA230001]|uniref:tRNA (adenosine(37)-N6)-threonylcarbamoyltransferase complex ATPase subunit type 1 TsaE n=1 Tax=Fontimonas sp. SYSU GA230001 TaxID=3142450 RepID=UPI0032B43FD8
MTRALSCELRGAAATEAAGAALARSLRGEPAIVFLEGELGAGKTTLARGFLRALGVRSTVRSPTYTLMEPYDIGACTVVHMDLYRLQDAEELWGLGLDSYPPDRDVWLVEWPERAEARLPVPRIRVRLQGAGQVRRFEVAADGALLDRLLAELQDLHEVSCLS